MRGEMSGAWSFKNNVVALILGCNGHKILAYIFIMNHEGFSEPNANPK